VSSILIVWSIVGHLDPRLQSQLSQTYPSLARENDSVALTTRETYMGPIYKPARFTEGTLRRIRSSSNLQKERPMWAPSSRGCKRLANKVAYNPASFRT
jgi:hypothetical protein